ncbi:MAG TPA: hypothetical protein VHH88_10420 [Verrucomicrobiae bacterium]|nr:hypothetical protein [Verrucomicrobiae bacterium]
MSKPSPNYFCVHTGFFRNPKTRELFDLIGERALFVPQMLWGFCAEQQTDADVSKMSIRRFRDAFALSGLSLSISETEKIVKAVTKVGFIMEGKMHSWDKYNKHFAEYEQRREQAKEAIQSRWKKSHSSNGNGNGNGSTPSQKIWLLDQAIKQAKNPMAKKALEKQRRELLSQETGEDLSEPAPRAVARSQDSAPKSSGKKFKAVYLQSARELLKESPDLLNENMITALVDAGDPLPAAVRGRFRKLLEQLEEKAGKAIPG